MPPSPSLLRTTRILSHFPLPMHAAAAAARWPEKLNGVVRGPLRVGVIIVDGAQADANMGVNANVNVNLDHAVDMTKAQVMLLTTGLSVDDISKAQVGITSVWYEGNPCNMHLSNLSPKIKEGMLASRLAGFQFTTIGVLDSMTNGNLGMRYLLQSHKGSTPTQRRDTPTSLSFTFE
ncbi:hypothetical protein M427DRAFT_31977 [Gonapodya prolifera JEL478]|uniref:Dihydroxy-acid/6-phosphogluconate dehydratase N-terminal domain-containing protein n=1 Tax=Gonapodya prolifera (strain JEL478) TaxID=1344416 RepID=A0A139AGU7_GONPJ|nr:hypothetical protein M427DRAFT_31977 [Gonapodya prolifera JEL478]|eukprot:KXS15784.1 hypothetical protein M427DRAFT_31977 [Gonapodya prolifera JEL478]